MLQYKVTGMLGVACRALVIFTVAFIVAVFFYCCTSKKDISVSVSDWPEYNGGPDRNHYSSLSEITAANIEQIEKVWEYSSGGADTVRNQTQMQCNPIIINGVLYGVSA